MQQLAAKPPSPPLRTPPPDALTPGMTHILWSAWTVVLPLMTASQSSATQLPRFRQRLLFLEPKGHRHMAQSQSININFVAYSCCVGKNRRILINNFGLLVVTI